MGAPSPIPQTSSPADVRGTHQGTTRGDGGGCGGLVAVAMPPSYPKSRVPWGRTGHPGIPPAPRASAAVPGNCSQEGLQPGRPEPNSTCKQHILPRLAALPPRRTPRPAASFPKPPRGCAHILPSRRPRDVGGAPGLWLPPSPPFFFFFLQENVPRSLWRGHAGTADLLPWPCCR